MALAKTLHFSRASELCHISAPTLSRNIKQLEDEVGLLIAKSEDDNGEMQFDADEVAKYKELAERFGGL